MHQGIRARLVCAALFVGSSATVRAADAGSATFGWGPGPDGPQVVQAIDKGFWTRHGLTVKTVTFSSGAAAMEALLGGQLDFAAMAESIRSKIWPAAKSGSPLGPRPSCKRRRSCKTRTSRQRC
jgi:ABC-type nitrate/sulfonate/bicarbonate transport system substrate-binding protein